MNMQNLYLIDKEREYTRTITERENLSSLVKHYTEQFRSNRSNQLKQTDVLHWLARYLSNKS